MFIFTFYVKSSITPLYTSVLLANNKKIILLDMFSPCEIMHIIIHPPLQWHDELSVGPQPQSLTFPRSSSGGGGGAVTDRGKV